MTTLTKNQFKAILTNPKLFTVRKKVHQLRKELKKINWKVYSKYYPGQMELELFGIDDSPHYANRVSDIVENIFPDLIYNIGYLLEASDQFRVYIKI